MRSEEEREFADRYYLAFCYDFHLDPEDQQSATAFEAWWESVHGQQ